MTLFVNEVDKGTTSDVSNGDRVQLEVCTRASYGAEELLTLHYGNHDDSVTEQSHDSPPPSPPPPSPRARRHTQRCGLQRRPHRLPGYFF